MKARHLLWIRRISQLLFFILFVYLLVEARLPMDVQIGGMTSSEGRGLGLEKPVTFFFRMDPLIWISTLLAGSLVFTVFLWAVAVIILTLLLGRIFCGFICPFGTLQHWVSRFRPALKGARLIRANQRVPAQRIKYGILLAVLVGTCLGLNLTGLVDPLSFLFRSLALAVLPGIGNLLKTLFHALAGSDIKWVSLMSYGAEVLVAPVFGYEFEAFQTGWFIGLIFLAILFLNRVRPRFWCRFLCPLGAMLGLFSRFSLLRLEKDLDACTRCGRCEKVCQGAAGPGPDAIWSRRECLTCFNCFDACPEGAIHFRFRAVLKQETQPDMGRRALLTGLAGGLSIPLLGRLDGRVHKGSDPRLIRPPGALEETDFLNQCARCGLCMKACPTNGINPALSEGGLAGFWTPRLIMTRGYCDYTCTLCGQVCPTGAIRSLTVREKTETPVRIGSAYLDRGRCLPWSGNGPCIVCEEHCPTSPKAISLDAAVVKGPDGDQKVQLPRVNLRQCVGCGICENKCPVRGRPAIRVISAGESRSAENRILLL